MVLKSCVLGQVLKSFLSHAMLPREGPDYMCIFDDLNQMRFLKRKIWMKEKHHVYD